MLTRINKGEVEILLGKRASSMRAFPNFWSFPGGGLSRKDVESATKLKLDDDEHGAMKICIVRELCEELGLTISNGNILPVDTKIRISVLENKENWLKEVVKGNIKFDPVGLTLIRERITPVFSPIRFHNRFFHLHISNKVPDFNLKEQTEFETAKWYSIKKLIIEWSKHSIYLPPPLFTLIRDLNLLLEQGIEINSAINNLNTDSNLEREINFSSGVICIPVKTATLPPASTTNCYLLGKKGGELLLVDPAAHHQDDINWIMELVNSLKGMKISILLTHRHQDHIGNLKELQKLTNAEIWCSKHTSDYLQLNNAKILNEGDIIHLKHPIHTIKWEVLITPGHCPGHICLFSRAGLIAGDMIAGFGTILIPNEGNMEIYIEQLERIEKLKPRMLFPSHGPLSSVPEKVLSHYISHRKKRQQRVYEAILSGIEDLASISKYTYEDTPDVHIGLSRQQTLAHLSSLERLGKVSRNNKHWKNI
jgi:glyoxylase-like metal-dependent hydrolase (beta-lactamase superfamily II)/8-oxo-dGTP pyrophosphatase MutT (NUDIX family)